jgi:hypothetical protein
VVQVHSGPPYRGIVYFSGAIAQLGERLICIQEVSGSIPLSSTKNLLVEIILDFKEYSFSLRLSYGNLNQVEKSEYDRLLNIVKIELTSNFLNFSDK